MRIRNLILSLFVAVVAAACAHSVPSAQPTAPAPVVEKKAEEPPKKVTPPPVQILAESPALATVDPETLKVTYAKGVDPKKVVDQVVKQWAQMSQQLQQCQAFAQALQNELQQKK